MTKRCRNGHAKPQPEKGWGTYIDPILNCILAVCCDPLTATQQDALAKFLTQRGLDANYAEECAKIMLAHFDLAPQGSLQAFKNAIAELARGPQHKG